MTRTIHATRYKIFISDLIKARKKANLTQQEVAQKLGRPQSYIAKIEGTERRLDIMEYIEIACVLGINPAKPILHLTEIAAAETEQSLCRAKKNR